MGIFVGVNCCVFGLCCVEVVVFVGVSVEYYVKFECGVIGGVFVLVFDVVVDVF